MSRSRLIRAFALCTVLTLATQAAWAGPARSGDTSSSAWGLLLQVWGSLTAGWSDVGCWIDPNGGCGNAQTPVPAEGCWLDPNGGCATTHAPAPPPVTEVGCIIDPHGGCGTGN